jgi:hypothetical protein
VFTDFHRDEKKAPFPQRECEFCKTHDPEFSRRRSSDRMVMTRDAASAHVTEDGHVLHLRVALRLRAGHAAPLTAA